jgi:O-acetylhomoserine (thiol)-lyase
MRAHVANALTVAGWLEQQAAVERVRHPGLESSPYRELVQRYLPRGAGSVFCFDLAGGREAGLRFIEALDLFSHLANVGDAKSLVIHPASTTHRQLSDAELAAAGIGPGTIRLSVGIEDADDLIWDLERGLAAAGER